MSITRKMLKGMGLTEDQQISTHATREGRQKAKRVAEVSLKFLLTPLREGRQQFPTNLLLPFVVNCQ